MTTDFKGTLRIIDVLFENNGPKGDYLFTDLTSEEMEKIREKFGSVFMNGNTALIDLEASLLQNFRNFVRKHLELVNPDLQKDLLKANWQLQILKDFKLLNPGRTGLKEEIAHYEALVAGIKETDEYEKKSQIYKMEKVFLKEFAREFVLAQIAKQCIGFTSPENIAKFLEIYNGNKSVCFNDLAISRDNNPSYVQARRKITLVVLGTEVITELARKEIHNADIYYNLMRAINSMDIYNDIEIEKIFFTKADALPIEEDLDYSNVYEDKLLAEYSLRLING